MLQQATAGLGELHAPAVAQQQRFAQLRFERTHLAAQGWLRHSQHQCRLAEAAVLGHVHEGFELVQVHRGILARGMPKLNSS